MKHFLRTCLIATSLVLGLTGCSRDFQSFWDGVSAVSTATVSATTVVVAAQSFDGLELVAAAYLDLPSCRAVSGPACRVPSATPIIKGAAKSGRIARNELKAQLRIACAAEYAAGKECTAGIPIASYNTLVAATKTIENATAAYRAVTGK